MLKPIRVGAELFHNLIENNCYYVDKTPFIRTVFQDNQSDVILITRPRRFGKTLTMSTFCDFLSLDHENPGDVSRQEGWFKDTEIFNDKDFCSKYMGKFPVIFVSLKSVEGNDFAGAYTQFGNVVYRMYNEFSYLSESERLSNADKKDFKEIADDRNFICNVRNKERIKSTLSDLTMFLYKHHGIKPIVLIDEYDVPIAKAAHKEYYDDMIDVIRLFLGNALKTNFNLGRAVLTGCLRVAKESIFTGLNNPLICSVLNLGNKDISRGIGFTKEETLDVLSYYGLSDYYDEVRKKYDGYYFGYVNMYCPWDVMSFCNENYLQAGEEGADITAENYWINTSGNDVIEEFMGYLKSDDTDRMQKLLDGESVITPVSASLCYGDLIKHNITDFWTLLLYTGYLTFDPKYRSETKGEYRLYIPNEEIRECFKSKIMDFFSNNQEMKGYTSDFVKGLFNGDGEKVENSLNELLAKYVSIRDFSTKAPKENYYHGFINGLLVNGASLIKEQKSNFESGNGYVDLILLSADKKAVSILELKQTENELDDRITISEKAAEQIIKKKYADQFKENKMIQSVFAWGICFCKKECSVVCTKLK